MLAANSEIEISNSDCLTALFAVSVDKWNMNDRERRQTVLFGFIEAKVIMSINSFTYFVIGCLKLSSHQFPEKDSFYRITGIR